MINLKNLTLRRGAKVVLQDASVTLHAGEKVSLVGRNGAGKSSLFALLTGKLHPDSGDAELPPRWRLAEVAQNMPETDEAATEFVLQGDTPLMEAREALAAAEATGDGHAIAEAHQRFEEAAGFDAPARAQALLLGLGFKPDQLDQPVNSFSGGWRMRLQLARALMCPADLLLLDEPTNHLDLDALVWLESWLKRFEGTMLVISHDREFLDAITRVTLHLDNAQLTRYSGNYSAFEAMRAERLMQQQSAFERQQDRIQQLTRFIDRFKAKATKAKQAQSRVKALERMEKLAPVLTAADFSFEFREPESLPNPMLSLKDVSCGYRGEASETVIVRNVHRSVLAGQRIGILGANGQGKSTLVKTIARALPPLGGQITEGKGLAIGYFAQQEMDVLRPDDSPLDHMIRLAKEVSPQAREQELRDFLGSFRFVAEMAYQPVGTMSGGEKARLVLAMLVWQRPNLLLLDEPTNHLDLATREALSLALNEFDGSVMLVSHDRALLREVCDEFWLVSRGGIAPFDGDLDDYQRWLLDQAKQQREAASASAPATASPNTSAEAGGANRRDERKAQAQARQRLAEQAKPLKKELAGIDQRLAALGTEKAGLEEALAGGSLTPAQLAEHGRRLKAIGDEVETLEERWLELSEQIEQLGA
ncbi:ABC-F family ATP-binding cassette domain-containing protein [Caldimonas brevitalea]|uniref:Probable ATP-binding protein YheS n=1 Tax=Caldimonas brevitalea TaxID=413882 RepID=A0A0G3BPJ8_9BURK|nr:ATP-binding cassette domain-containing protein [Caldimonas brevitalea]AKJ29261.1 ABC transporter [Caldimonas brevitalea]